eukprot:scaffold181352_cov31-Tisochrysis_lutea.AAC.4
MGGGCSPRGGGECTRDSGGSGGRTHLLPRSCVTTRGGCGTIDNGCAMDKVVCALSRCGRLDLPCAAGGKRSSVTARVQKAVVWDAVPWPLHHFETLQPPEIGARAPAAMSSRNLESRDAVSRSRLLFPALAFL